MKEPTIYVWRCRCGWHDALLTDGSFAKGLLNPRPRCPRCDRKVELHRLEYQPLPPMGVADAGRPAPPEGLKT